jgi:hypothetical protein
MPEKDAGCTRRTASSTAISQSRVETIFTNFFVEGNVAWLEGLDADVFRNAPCMGPHQDVLRFCPDLLFWKPTRPLPLTSNWTLPSLKPDLLFEPLPDLFAC